MKFQILLDTFEIEKHPSTMHIYCGRDYLRACEAIDLALKEAQSIRVAVHNQAMATWFDQYRGIPGIEIKRLDPISLLAYNLNIPVSGIPRELQEDPKYVIDEDLIDEAQRDKLQDGQSVISWVLKHVLGEVWLTTRIDDPIALGKIITALAQLSSLRLSPTTLALLDLHLMDLAIENQHSGIINWIREGLMSGRAKQLLMARIISNYPVEIQAKALQFDDSWANLALLPDRVTTLTMVPLEACQGLTIPRGFSEEVRAFIREQINNIGIKAVLPYISGVLEEEQIILSKYIEERYAEIDETWVPVFDELEKKFGNVYPAASFICWLQRIRPPAKPKAIRNEFTYGNVLLWATEEYFPFYTWACIVNRLSITEDNVTNFEEWLVANYRVLTKSDAFAPLAIRELLATHSDNCTPLLIVIDGLPWEYAGYLQKQIASFGEYYVDVRPGFAGIPSATAYAKHSLIAGKLTDQLTAQDDANISYSKQFAEVLNYTESDTLVGRPSMGNLSQLVQEKKKAYLYLVNRADQMIHEPAQSEARRESIYAMLSDLVSQIYEAIKMFMKLHQENLAVIITSDHGFTELPQSSKVINVAEDIAGYVSHNRLLHTPDDNYPQIEGLQLIGRDILPGFQGTLQIAKGYSCIKAKPKGATHGGLTPQEIIVPIIVLNTAESSRYNMPEVGILGEVRRGRAVNPLKITIVNSNSLPMTLEEIRLRLIKIETRLPQKIGPNGTLELDAFLDGSKLAQETVRIIGVISTNFGGISRSDEVDREYPTVGAALADSDFESEFYI